MNTLLKLAITIDMVDMENGERWTRARSYDVPRGLHIGRLLEELDSAVHAAARIVRRKQKARLDAELASIEKRIQIEKDQEVSRVETEAAEVEPTN